jgi:hypothetical protein
MKRPKSWWRGVRQIRDGDLRPPFEKSGLIPLCHELDAHPWRPIRMLASVFYWVCMAGRTVASPWAVAGS